MANKLLAGIVFLALAGCSEPAEHPVITKKLAESSLYVPLTTDSAINTLTLWVAAEKRECMAVGPSECLQIRFHPNEEWQLFYGDIVGFDYQPGQLYQIEVGEVLLPEPPADAPDRQWVFQHIISKEPE